ncbi:unnamed protein product [Heligmosomoides polygyrus]|uniref:SCP domain-containing protein n=1 Tax=Heligmosomoides polygyrus TaxID=6339 RepID=A0A183FA93_HELPZ|nr:unnamed protein product [Heligmosomoides polygyrus]
MRIRYTDRLTNEEYYKAAAARATSTKPLCNADSAWPGTFFECAPATKISHAMDTARKANQRPPKKHVASHVFE